MQARPNHEDPGPSSDLVAPRPEIGTTSSALLHPQPAAACEAKGRAMVLRRQWARRVLLRTGDDHAPGARRPGESCHLLPRRSNHGPAERLAVPHLPAGSVLTTCSLRDSLPLIRKSCCHEREELRTSVMPRPMPLGVEFLQDLRPP